MAKITALRPKGKITTTELVALANDTDLGHFQIICHWTDGNTTCGWSTGITDGELVFGANMMDEYVRKHVFED